MIYLKEPNTNRIVEFQSEASIGAGFRDWTILTESEILAYELEQAKALKIEQLKANRNKLLDKYSYTQKAFEIIIVEEEDVVTENEVYFEFATKGDTELTNPTAIIFTALRGIPVRYSCKIIEGEERRAGYVQMTQSVADSISNHLRDRATGLVKTCNDIEKEIENVENLEDLEAINITIMRN